MRLSEFIQQLAPVSETGPVWAFDRYKENLAAAIKTFGFKSVLEVGGGRSPLFTIDEIQSLDVSYTVNDIEASELALAPPHVDKQCFDIGGETIPDAQYDLIFSSCVFEHLKDTRRAYQNLLRLLNPGGIVLNLHPCLFSVPFVVNKLVPETLAASFVAAAIGGDHHKKFPAYYSWCYATSNVNAMLRQVGFAEAEIIPFYGHTYYKRIPPLLRAHQSFSRQIAKIDMRWAASYAYTMGRRGT